MWHDLWVIWTAVSVLNHQLYNQKIFKTHVTPRFLDPLGPLALGELREVFRKASNLCLYSCGET